MNDSLPRCTLQSKILCQLMNQKSIEFEIKNEMKIFVGAV